MFQHDLIVHVADSIGWKRQVREELQFAQLFGHSMYESFTLNGIAVTSWEPFRQGSAADEAVVWNFVQVWLRIDVVELFDVVDVLEAQVVPVDAMSVNAVHDRVFDAKMN